VLEFDRWVTALGRRHAWLPPGLLLRWARAYGTRIDTLLGTAACLQDLGEEVAAGLYACELRYLVEHEWATCAADVLWRRSKLGLHLPPGCADDVDAWIAGQRRAAGAVAVTEPA
jgi:glycerol-3-phosphate dehydrogenase